MRSQSLRSRKGAMAHSMTLRPASCKYCLGGPELAMRRELPAAGITTQCLVSLGLSLVSTGRVLRRHDLVERLALADHPQIRARALFDRRRALLEILHFGRERAVALAQVRVLFLLRGDLRMQPRDFADAAVAEPQPVLDQYQQDQQTGGEELHGAPLQGFRGIISTRYWAAAPGTPRRQHSAPLLPVPLRFAAAGCTWRCDRSATSSPS